MPNDLLDELLDSDPSDDLDDIPDAILLDSSPDPERITPPERLPDGTGGPLGTAGTPGVSDQLVDLDQAQRIALLKSACVEVTHVVTSDEFQGNVTALTIQNNGEFGYAGQAAISCSRISLRPTTISARQRFASLYSQQELFWSNLALGEVDANAGLPGLFKAAANARFSREDLVTSSASHAYYQGSQLYPKVRVVLEGISPADNFISAVSNAVSSQSAERLLEVLDEYGHFLPLQTVLGGRVNLIEIMNRDDAFEADQTFASFRSTVNSVLDGAELDGKVKAEDTANNRAEVTVQQRALTLETVGGEGSAASAIRGDAQSYWKLSLNGYKTWRPIAYEDGSLVPLIDLLPAELRSQCFGLLRKYFLDHLSVVATEKPIGNNNPTGRFAGTYAEKVSDYSTRISQMFFNHGKRLHQFCTIRTTSDGKRVLPAKWNGGNRKHAIPPEKGNDKQHDDWHSFTLDPDDEIIAVEVHSVNSDRVNALVFHTAKGRRYPMTGQFGGRGAEDKPTYRKVLRAPRICGFTGAHARMVDSFGLLWRKVDDNLPRRTFILLLEPYLMSEHPLRDN